MQKTNNIIEAPQEELELKIFTRTPNVLSNPKLSINKEGAYSQLSQREADRDEYDLNSPLIGRKYSPDEIKNQKSNQLFTSDRIEIMSERAQNLNMLGKKTGKTRRTT